MQVVHTVTLSSEQLLGSQLGTEIDELKVASQPVLKASSKAGFIEQRRPHPDWRLPPELWPCHPMRSLRQGSFYLEEEEYLMMMDNFEGDVRQGLPLDPARLPQGQLYVFFSIHTEIIDCF